MIRHDHILPVLSKSAINRSDISASFLHERGIIWLSSLYLLQTLVKSSRSIFFHASRTKQNQPIVIFEYMTQSNSVSALDRSVSNKMFSLQRESNRTTDSRVEFKIANVRRVRWLRFTSVEIERILQSRLTYISIDKYLFSRVFLTARE